MWYLYIKEYFGALAIEVGNVLVKWFDTITSNQQWYNHMEFRWVWLRVNGEVL